MAKVRAYAVKGLENPHGLPDSTADDLARELTTFADEGSAAASEVPDGRRARRAPGFRLRRIVKAAVRERADAER